MNIKWLSIASGALLLFGILNLPYGYYVFLRLAICVSSAVVAYHFYNVKKSSWTVIFGAIALLFNPFIPVYLTKEIWVSIDFISAILFFVVGLQEGLLRGGKMASNFLDQSNNWSKKSVFFKIGFYLLMLPLILIGTIFVGIIVYGLLGLWLSGGWGW